MAKMLVTISWSWYQKMSIHDFSDKNGKICYQHVLSPTFQSEALRITPTDLKYFAGFWSSINLLVQFFGFLLIFWNTFGQFWNCCHFRFIIFAEFDVIVNSSFLKIIWLNRSVIGRRHHPIRDGFYLKLFEHFENTWKKSLCFAFLFNLNLDLWRF